jgi:peptide deformylase
MTVLSYSKLSIMLCSALIVGGSRALAFPCARRIPSRTTSTGVRIQYGFSLYKYQPTRLFSASQKSLEEEVDPGQVEGTNLRLVKYPHPSLRAPNSEIEASELKDGSIAQLAKEMFLYMYAAEGVGLAAPQVGVNKRLMVYNPSGDRSRWLDEIVMVNPRIVEYSEAKDLDIEGCLSFPDMTGDVERSKWIKVEALNLRGKKLKRKFAGWEAVSAVVGIMQCTCCTKSGPCVSGRMISLTKLHELVASCQSQRIFQHEYDHLDGIVYVDRLSEKERQKVQPNLDQLIQEFGAGGAL